MNNELIFSIERPSSDLLKLYVIRSLLTGPFFILVLPMLLIRYFTLRYTFDEKGVSMRWGFLFRREVNLTYTRIQDIHLMSGIIQRWLGLADIMIQTASGNASAEMKIEGLHEYDAIRSFIYSRMRGYKPQTGETGGVPTTEVTDALQGILTELKAAREVLEQKAAPAKGEDHV